MIEIIAIVLGCIGSIGSLGTAGYKCYKIYKQQDNPIVNIHNHNNNNSHSAIEQMILDEIRERKSGDSDTSVDIKINIHSNEEIKKITKEHLHKD